MNTLTEQLKKKIGWGTTDKCNFSVVAALKGGIKGGGEIDRNYRWQRFHVGETNDIYHLSNEGYIGQEIEFKLERTKGGKLLIDIHDGRLEFNNPGDSAEFKIIKDHWVFVENNNCIIRPLIS